ncbi:hypothetical protein ACTXT7_000846 [Hymenolepis weldensis]
MHEIEAGSVAHRSGQIMLGDRLLKIGDQEITSRENVMDLFQGCGLCAKITLMRQQHHWKQVPSRLPSSYSAPSYLDSTLDIGISNVAYAHLPTDHLDASDSAFYDVFTVLKKPFPMVKRSDFATFVHEEASEQEEQCESPNNQLRR